MGTLTLSYYDTYSVDLGLAKIADQTYKLTFSKNDSTESKSHSSTVEYYLTENQLDDIMNFITENK